jgi:hypothetical protein
MYPKIINDNSFSAFGLKVSLPFEDFVLGTGPSFFPGASLASGILMKLIFESHRKSISKIELTHGIKLRRKDVRLSFDDTVFDTSASLMFGGDVMEVAQYLQSIPYEMSFLSQSSELFMQSATNAFVKINNAINIEETLRNSGVVSSFISKQPTIDWKYKMLTCSIRGEMYVTTFGKLNVACDFSSNHALLYNPMDETFRVVSLPGLRYSYANNVCYISSDAVHVEGTYTSHWAPYLGSAQPFEYIMRLCGITKDFRDQFPTSSRLTRQATVSASPRINFKTILRVYQDGKLDFDLYLRSLGATDEEIESISTLCQMPSILNLIEESKNYVSSTFDILTSLNAKNFSNIFRSFIHNNDIIIDDLCLSMYLNYVLSWFLSVSKARFNIEGSIFLGLLPVMEFSIK